MATETAMTKMALENGKAAGGEVPEGGAMAVTAVSEIFEIKMNTVNLMIRILWLF